MLGESSSIVKAEHFKTHCGTSSNRNQAAEHFGLQQMMVGVVMPLAEEEEVSASQTGDETPVLNKSGRGDVPNTPGERMILTKGRFPGRDRAPRHGTCYVAYNQYQGGEIEFSSVWCG
jgi:hypothetical protein